MAARVLHILSSTMRAGVAVMVMNLYRELDREIIQFDFVAHELGDDDFDAEIEQLGGRVFRIPFLSEAGMSGFVRQIRGIIEQHGPYTAVHAHTDYQSGFCALAAKQAGVPIRLCHAHSDTRYIRSPLFTLKKLLGRALINRCATQRCACSQNAALSTFGKRAVRLGSVTVIPNDINLSHFTQCPPETKAELRLACHADASSHLVGCVGRLSPEKNPGFLLDIAAKAHKAELNICFLYIGTGVLLDKLSRSAAQLGLSDTVCFLGVRSDVPQLLQCLDLVVVPSYTEGFSLAALEAQAAGTPVLVSSGVPNEADMGLGLFHALPLSSGADAWLTAAADIMDASVHPDMSTRFQAITQHGYDVKTNTAQLLRLYGVDSGQGAP